MFLYIFLCAVGFLAGFIDSVAGGGGLLTTPALLVVNLPPHIVLGTNKFQSMFGTASALINFIKKRKVVWSTAIVGIPFALAGSVAGTKLILIIPASLVAKIIIFAIPPAALFVVFFKSIFKKSKTGKAGPFQSYFITPLVCFIIGGYDGFLGPGTGSILILVLVFLSRLSFIEASATAKTFNLASNAGSFVTFLISGCVYLPYAIPMAVSNIAGNIIGSHFAIKKGDNFVRKLLLVSLSALFAYLIWKYF